MIQAKHLRLVEGERGELEINTALVRRFQLIAPDEFVELTALVENKPWVCHVGSEAEHLQALREAEQIRGFCGAYQLVNGPLDRSLSARYEPGRWHRAWNGRAADDHIGSRRAIFFDVDPVRPKGISSTGDQLREAFQVSRALEEWLVSVTGDKTCIGHGCSGNGYFTLVAIEPASNTPEVTARVMRLLKLVAKKFNTETVKLDTSVFNAARLMACPGTWKRKGRNTTERPHRMTTFICCGDVARIPMEVLC